MRITISAGNRKRAISGPFQVCGSRHDLELLRDRLNVALNPDDNFCYGWVSIHEASKLLADTEPEPWE